MRTPLLDILAVAGLLWPVTLTQSDVIFASLHDGQNLATRIHCQVEEEQHFRYSSESTLWGAMGGKIFMEADIVLRCIGTDLEGKYGSEALKYDVQISNLRMSEETQSESILGRRREKRGATRDFFSNSWKKVKNFFNRMLGRRPTEDAETKRASSGKDDPVSDGGGESADDETDEVSAELSSLYEVPFQVVQLSNGSIPEIRFSENEVEEGRVKNFKRHLADAFSTRLHAHPVSGEVERSVIGEHTSTYNISVTGEKSNYNSAGFVSSTHQPPEKETAVIVVNRVTTTDDIVRFAPSDALNDREGMDIRSHQMQIFRDGRMTVSRGISSLSLVTDRLTEVKKRKKRATEDDATSYIRTETAFDLQLRRRSRRSVEDPSDGGIQKHSFRASSRIAEVEDVRSKKRLTDFQESVDLNSILDDLMSGRETDTEDKMQSLGELIKEEIKLNLDEDADSLCNAIRTTFTLKIVEEMCIKNFSACKDYLELIALAGGDAAEEIFLDLIRNSSSSRSLPPDATQVIVDILSDISRPSVRLLTKLIEIVRNESASAVGALSIGLGHLASEAGHDLKSRVSNLFSEMLAKRECEGDPLIIDLLEAVGNLKCDRITSRILEISKRCRENSAVQIASIHALRHSSLEGEDGVWLQALLKEGDCDVQREVIGSLMDRIQDQEMTPDLLSWPRFHFNDVDEYLKHSLEEEEEKREEECSSEDILLYFSRKKNVEANEIARNQHFDQESESWKPGGRTLRRQKRRTPWDDLNCQEWKEDSRYNPIQGKEEFASDRSTYNKRKSCLAFRKLGLKGANAEIYAGMFAGLKEPSDPPKYKLFTKFVSGFNFLGQQVEVGSFYFYLYSGKTKAYVRIMGRTRQEFTNDGCTPTELRYRPLKHIPLYMVSIANVQMSLGIHLSSRLSVDTLCPEDHVYQLQPLTNVRIGGEALGTVGFIRGAANLGANFNYKLQFTFTPTPNMCLKGSHGFDPMNVNFESYFQLWNQVKQEWGKMRVWKPSFTSWELKRGELKQWFEDTCIALQQEASNTNSNERELE